MTSAEGISCFLLGSGQDHWPRSIPPSVGTWCHETTTPRATQTRSNMDKVRHILWHQNWEPFEPCPVAQTLAVPYHLMLPRGVCVMSWHGMNLAPCHGWLQPTKSKPAGFP